MLLNIGFTGTRLGMSNRQQRLFKELLSYIYSRNNVLSFHHGDCVGADYQAHNIISRDYKIPIEIHPPLGTKFRAFCRGDNVVEVYPPLSYLARDRRIVAVCDLLIACPGSVEKARGSGTWYTIRYAKSSAVPIYIIY